MRSSALRGIIIASGGAAVAVPRRKIPSNQPGSNENMWSLFGGFSVSLSSLSLYRLLLLQLLPVSVLNIQYRRAVWNCDIVIMNGGIRFVGLWIFYSLDVCVDDLASGCMIC